MPSEAGGFTPSATDVVQCVNPTVKELEPLPSADAVNTVGGLLSGGEDVEMNEQAAGNPCIRLLGGFIMHALSACSSRTF